MFTFDFFFFFFRPIYPLKIVGLHLERMCKVLVLYKKLKGLNAVFMMYTSDFECFLLI